ncbi:DUF4202 domain-containing protein [Flectobacillus longus]|uniref:DUF4202 domain-containing protein n=1 Tax=Flectobacillus longus TaxID=2984207 RepID=UPI0024B7FBA0|nr:DUF4202 domain-containing protein [Flectobacillus longus]MDI9882473.1 DUF4202 domain-containing protein [Flectobacillus longus]
MEKIRLAFEKFDDYNKQDPNSFEWNGEIYPQEYFMALKCSDWVLKLDPQASEELQLASRSQHIGRWSIPRNTYPEGKVGYLTWRKDLGKFHAETAAKILEEVGYEEPVIERVKQIITKQKIKQDADVQTIENALCLVFLEFQYESFFQKHDDEKMVEIIRKSLLKMDAHGHRFALQLSYSEKGLALIQKALERLG